MTIETLRPSSASLSDDSDGTYLNLWYDPPDGYENTRTEALGTFTLSGGAVTKRVRTRVRGKSETLYGGTATVDTSVAIGGVTAVGSITMYILGEYVGAWTSAPGLTQGDIDAASVTLTRLGGLPRLYEVYVDVDYIATPVMATGSPTTPSMTATPTYTGTATIDPDSDTGAQTAVQARVFTAAQYAAGGFNPATSTSTWDSGELTQTSPDVVQDGGVLVTGITYHLFMRVAQAVGGTRVWSDWDEAAATFALDASLSPVGVDTVTPVVDVDTGEVTITVDRDTAEDAWTTVAVERSIDGGVTWRAVGADTTPDADEAVVVDVLAPSGVDILYRAQAFAATGAISPWVEAAATVTYSPTVAWLRSAESAVLATTIRLRRVPEWDQSWRNGWAAPIGSPYVVGGHDMQSGRSGSLSILCLNQVELDAVLAVFAASPVVLLQFPSSWELGGDMWAVATQLSRPRRVRAASIAVYDVDVDITETVEPS